MGVISPSLPKSWHAILEVILRVTCVALCLIILICAIVTLSAVESINDSVVDINEFWDVQYEYGDANDYEAAAGWLAFVAVMGMAIEPVIIILRILNISCINKNFLIFGIVDIAISGIFLVSLLAGGAANASYSTENRDTIDDYEERCQNQYYTVLRAFQDVCDDLPRVRDAEAASAAFSFIGMVAFGALAGIMIVNILFRNKSTSSNPV